MQPIYIPNRIGKITAAKNVIAVSKHRSETGSRVGFVQGVSSGGPHSGQSGMHLFFFLLPSGEAEIKKCQKGCS